MRKRYLSIVIVPEGGGRSLRGRISYLVLGAIVVSLLFLVFFILFFSFQYGKISLQAVKGAQAEKRVKFLERELSKVEKLEGEVAKLKAVKNQIEGMLGVVHHSEPRSPNGTNASRPSIWPVKEKIVTREFSMEHQGIDVAVPEGYSVWATADGVVVFAGWDEDLGYLVEIGHEDSLKTVYGHNSQVLVEKGSQVKRGDVISFSGSSGRSTAPHLHYEVLLKGKRVDPREYLGKGS